MTFLITIQRASLHSSIPTDAQLKLWTKKVLTQLHCSHAEITLRLVNHKESALLNQQFRHKTGSTNVLTFVYDAETPWGDIVLCAPLIAQQAKQQFKLVTAHWAHLLVHGVLHLLGYDHVTPQQNRQMQKIEIQLLQRLHFPNPYLLSTRTKKND